MLQPTVNKVLSTEKAVNTEKVYLSKSLNGEAGRSPIPRMLHPKTCDHTADQRTNQDTLPVNNEPYIYAEDAGKEESHMVVKTTPFLASFQAQTGTEMA